MFIIIKIFNIYLETVNKASFYPKSLEEYFLLDQIRLLFGGGANLYISFP